MKSIEKLFKEARDKGYVVFLFNDWTEMKDWQVNISLPGKDSGHYHSSEQAASFFNKHKQTYCADTPQEALRGAIDLMDKHAG